MPGGEAATSKACQHPSTNQGFTTLSLSLHPTPLFSFLFHIPLSPFSLFHPHFFFLCLCVFKLSGALSHPCLHLLFRPSSLFSFFLYLTLCLSPTLFPCCHFSFLSLQLFLICSCLIFSIFLSYFNSLSPPIFILWFLPPTPFFLCCTNTSQTRLVRNCSVVWGLQPTSTWLFDNLNNTRVWLEAYSVLYNRYLLWAWVEGTVDNCHKKSDFQATTPSNYGLEAIFMIGATVILLTSWIDAWEDFYCPQVTIPGNTWKLPPPPPTPQKKVP